MVYLWSASFEWVNQEYTIAYMKIRFFGQRNNLGGGTHYSNFVDAASKTYFINSKIEEINRSDQNQLQEALNTSATDDVNIWFWYDSNMRSFKGAHILWAIFESDKPSQFVINQYSQADLIWAPSQWAKGVLIDNGIDAKRIDVVPEGVDVHLYHPFLRKAHQYKNAPLRFLSIGKYEERKSYRELLAGFKKAFGNSNEVELIIKGDYFIQFDQKKQELIELVTASGLTNVKLPFGNYEKEKLVALYNLCDVFVFPSKAEGWGLPLLEAAATGMPLVSTFYSGHTEFLQAIPSSTLKIDFNLQAIKDPEFIRYWPAEDENYGLWAQPDVDSIAQQLKAVKERYAYFYNEASNTSLVIREQFNWDNAWSIALSSLQKRNYLNLGYVVGEK